MRKPEKSNDQQNDYQENSYVCKYPSPLGIFAFTHVHSESCRLEFVVRGEL